MLGEILELYDYNRWANRRVLTAASRLSPEKFTRDLGSSFPSVRDTLVHILGAEWIWLSRWQGVSPPALPEPQKFPTPAVLATRWRAVEGEQAGFLESLTEAALHEMVAYHNTQGQPFAYPLWRMLRHVVNHSTYHRGQVITLLRQLRAGVVGTDLLLYYDENPQSAVVGAGA